MKAMTMDTYDVRIFYEAIVAKMDRLYNGFLFHRLLFFRFKLFIYFAHMHGRIYLILQVKHFYSHNRITRDIQADFIELSRKSSKLIFISHSLRFGSQNSIHIHLFF